MRYDKGIRVEEVWRVRGAYKKFYPQLDEHRIKITRVGKLTDELIDCVEFYDMEIRPTENLYLNRAEFIEKFEKVY